MRKYLGVIIIVASVGLATPAFAELFVNPVSKAKTGSVGAGLQYTSSEADYEDDAGDSVEIENTILSGTVTYGASDVMDIYATIGSITDSDFEGVSGDGSLYGFGLLGELPSSNDVSVRFYAQYLSSSTEWSESYNFGGPGKETLDVDLTEISIGLGAGFQSENLKGYVGGEFVVSSDGDAHYEDIWNGALWAEADFDVEREDSFIVRLAGEYSMDSGLAINAGLAIAGESTFSIGISKAF